MEKLPEFIKARQDNWQFLHLGLTDLSDRFILPEATPHSQPSWFGFLLTLKENAGFTRQQIITFLEANGIQTRMLFAGNLLKHPCFDELRITGQGYRVVGNLINTDLVLEQTFWVGIYPGLKAGMLDHILAKIHEFCTANPPTSLN